MDISVQGRGLEHKKTLKLLKFQSFMVRVIIRGIEQPGIFNGLQPISNVKIIKNMKTIENNLPRAVFLDTRKTAFIYRML